MRRAYRLLLAYDGAPFFGFRVQRDGPTVEGAILDALRGACPDWTGRVEVAGATDRGVHALGQVVTLRFRVPMDPDRLVDGLEAGAPPSVGTPFARLDAVLRESSIRVREIAPVDWSFHASFSAKRRRYRYVLASDLDVVRVDALLRGLVGNHDFDAYARKPGKGRSTRKTLYRARAWRDGERLWCELEASGFVRRQVRVTVATALREAAAEAPPDTLLRLAEKGERRATAPPAPPGGLCLVHVDYGGDRAPSHGDGVGR